MGDFFKRKETSEFKKRVLNAPRVSKKKYNTLNKDLYKLFLEKYKYEISWKEFKEIITKSNIIATDIIINNRDGFDLPFMLGKIIIATCNKKKDKNYNWKVSEEVGRDVFFKNWESNQYLCKIFYTNFGTKYKFPLMNFWSFRPSRDFKKKTSENYRKNWNFYWKIPPFQKIGRFLSDNIKSIKIDKNEKKGKRMDLSDTQPE